MDKNRKNSRKYNANIFIIRISEFIGFEFIAKMGRTNLIDKQVKRLKSCERRPEVDMGQGVWWSMGSMGDSLDGW